MLFSGQGLKGVATNDLKLVLRAVPRPADLPHYKARPGDGRTSIWGMSWLISVVSTQGVTAVLVAVIAERGPR